MLRQNKLAHNVEAFRKLGQLEIVRPLTNADDILTVENKIQMLIIVTLLEHMINDDLLLIYIPSAPIF